jgi:hypothetical protein
MSSRPGSAHQHTTRTGPSVAHRRPTSPFTVFANKPTSPAVAEIDTLQLAQPSNRTESTKSAPRPAGVMTKIVISSSCASTCPL